MKIFCTSDWHLGNLFHGSDRTREHEHFFSWLTAQIHDQQPDALLVAGDVFDNANPSANAQTLYYQFLADATKACPEMQIVITAGNHDSANRLDAPRPLLSRYHVEVRGTLPRKFVPNEDGKGQWEIDYDDMMVEIHNTRGERAIVLAVPYLRADVTIDQSYSKGVNTVLHTLTDKARDKYPHTPLIMMAHMYATGAEIREHSSERVIIGGQEQVNLDTWPSHPDYLTSGHIHKRQHIWDTDWARYTGSVLPMSFTEKDYHHGIDMVCIDSGQAPSVTLLEYPIQHALVSLPEEGAADKAELLRLIQSLPDRQGGVLSDSAVYLELKLRSSRILAEERDEIQKALDAKDAVICCLQQVSEHILPTTIEGETPIRTLDDLLHRDPIEAVKECFQADHKKPFNPHQTDLLTEIIHQITIAEH